MSRDKTARWLDLLAFLLQHHYPVTREQMFERVQGYGEGGESARRKFERDKDDLRGLGIDIQTVTLPSAPGDEPASGYLLKAKDFYLPYLELTEGREPSGQADGQGPGRPYQLHQVRVSQADVERLDRATQRISESNLPLARAAASARRKLGFDLPLSLQAVERVLERPLAPEASASLAVLQEAVAKHRAVRCRYFAIGRDAEEERVIEPYGLFFSWGRWYCVARSRERNALRVFRVDRMSGAAMLDGKDAAFAVPGDFSIREYLGRAPWELSEAGETKVRVRFSFPESRWVMARGTGDPVVPMLADGGAELEFGVRDENPFLRWLLTFGDHAEVLSPEVIKSRLAALRRKVAELYAKESA